MATEWDLARARWQRGMLLPMEKALAVVAFGQLLRVSADFMGFWDFVRLRVPKVKRSDASAFAREPTLFFHIKGDDGTLEATPEAHALLERFLALSSPHRSA